MNRRRFLHTSVAGATAGSLAAAAPKPTTRPNLLVVHCDELNFRTLGCYRDTLPPEQAFMWGRDHVVETPNIDALARQGVLLTKMYAATPVCSPSRSSLLSGQYPQHTPVVNNNVPLADEVVSFATLLGQAGYATGYAGKWHLNGSGKPEWAPERKFGFDDNRFMFNRGHWKQFEDTPQGPRVKARDKGRPSYSVKGADEESFATDWLADKAIDFAREHKDEPWCYMLSIPDPHGPDTVRAPYDTMYDDRGCEKPRTYDKDAADAPSWATPTQKCKYGMASYYGMVKCIDDNVGRVVAALEADGQLDRTIVVFTADHGDMRGEHRRQNKGIPLEASAKIPCVVRWPGALPAGARVDQVVNTVDFLPTFMALMGVDTAGREDGRDLSGLLRGGDPPKEADDITFMRSTGKVGGTEGWIAAVTPRHKLVLSSRDPAWLLDLEKDPDELVNFAQRPSHRATARRLARALAAYGERHEDPYLTHDHTRRTLEQLLET